MMRDSDGVWFFLLSVFGLAVHDDFGGHTYIYTIGLIWVADFVVEPALCFSSSFALFSFHYLFDRFLLMGVLRLSGCMMMYRRVSGHRMIS